MAITYKELNLPGDIIYNIDPITHDGDYFVNITATLDGEHIPFSPSKFKTDAFYVQEMGLNLAAIPDGEFTYSYMPTGELLMNARYVDQNTILNSERPENQEGIKTYIDIPANKINSVRFNCSVGSIEKCFDVPKPTDKGLGGGVIAIIAVCSLVVIVVVVVVVIMAGRKKKYNDTEGNNIEEELEA